MNNISPDLIWNATKKRSSFLVKRNGAQFSSEPGNLMNSNSFKYSGLANPKTVDVRQAGAKGLTLVLKNKKANKPSKSTQQVQLRRSDVRAASKTLKALVDRSFYRRDLTQAALARVTKLICATQRTKLLSEGRFSVVHGRAGPKRKEFTFAKKDGKKKTDLADAEAFGGMAGADDSEPAPSTE